MLNLPTPVRAALIIIMIFFASNISHAQQNTISSGVLEDISKSVNTIRDVVSDDREIVQKINDIAISLGEVSSKLSNLSAIVSRIERNPFLFDLSSLDGSIFNPKIARSCSSEQICQKLSDRYCSELGYSSAKFIRTKSNLSNITSLESFICI